MWNIFEHGGSHISAQVLLNVLNKLWKRDTMEGLLSVYSVFFYNEFNKFNNKEAKMIDSIYHMTLNLFENCLLA